MSNMDHLRERADELRSLGLSKRRAFGVLRREFPFVERDQLHLAMPLEGAPRGVTPGWALWGTPLRPCQIRFKQKGRAIEEEPVTVRTRKVISMDYPILTVEACDLRAGDWLEGEGVVSGVHNYKGTTFVWIRNRPKAVLHTSAAHVKVRLEDCGDES